MKNVKNVIFINILSLVLMIAYSKIELIQINQIFNQSVMDLFFSIEYLLYSSAFFILMFEYVRLVITKTKQSFWPKFWNIYQEAYKKESKKDMWIIGVSTILVPSISFLMTFSILFLLFTFFSSNHLNLKSLKS